MTELEMIENMPRIKHLKGQDYYMAIDLFNELDRVTVEEELSKEYEEGEPLPYGFESQEEKDMILEHVLGSYEWQDYCLEKRLPFSYFQDI